MSRQRVSDASLLPVRDCLGHTCGTNIDTEGVEFTNKQPNLTYIDKVFSFNKDTASPILFNLNTGGENTSNFVVRFFLDGSSLFPCTLSPNAIFEIDNSFVVVEYFNTRPPGNITAAQVTLDGFPVDSISFTNGQYTAATTNVLPRIEKERCLDRGLPTKAFFLINNAGPWDFRAIYVLEGTVNTNGRICRFRAEISNAPNSPNTSLPSGSLSSFAIRNLSLPCAINGVAPNILFQFSAKINLVNPRLVVNCGNMDEFCRVSLVTTLAVEPVVNVESVRKTLFCINACEGLQPCQGSVAAAEAIEDIEDCEIGGINRPDCRCSRNNAVSAVTDSNRNPLADIVGVGNQNLGGITVGAGTCEDCVWGETRGHNCIPCRRSRDDVLGVNDKTFLERLLKEILEELSEDTGDAAGIGFGPDGTMGLSSDDEILDTSDRNTTRTASRHHSSNGCSW
ncbi:MAG TPA: hypothetical protein VM577_20880 [Anaerovoracaceae bacterium]|nr:hypothetical protein [Anaerovoracaceae bacterium]